MKINFLAFLAYEKFPYKSMQQLLKCFIRYVFRISQRVTGVIFEELRFEFDNQTTTNFRS